MELIARLLDERGITDHEAFLNPDYDARPNPFLLPDMAVAVERILNAIKNEKKIAVWHDYDCDGIPGGALLSDFFSKINYPATLHVAERNEGYGLNEDGLRLLAADGIKLLITVDCGITENEMVAFAQSLGIDVIVTDHHLPSDTLPEAIAVVNPHRTDSVYPEKVLCGTGVAFKLVEALIQKGNFDLPDGWHKWLLDLVALATVADMVPLTGENRTLVKFGLDVMHKGRRKGLAALLKKERIPISSVTEDDIGFSIAPKINAASRMESPRLAVELLITTDAARAEALAAKLISLNSARKLEGARVAKEVKRRLELSPVDAPIIVMGSGDWRPSLLGIAGNNVIETYKKTVCLWGRDGGLIKGSIRSCGDVNVVELMRGASHAMTDFGGHESSGGFSTNDELIHSLHEALEASYASALQLTVVSNDSSTHDGTLSLSEVTDATYDALRTLAPFGMNNAKPIFKFPYVRVERVMLFGKASEHLKLQLSDESGSAEAITFFIGRTSYKDTIDLLSPGDKVTLSASLDRSYFGGRSSLRLRIHDLVLT